MSSAADADTFTAAGFAVQQMGGGTTAWFKGLPDSYYLLITDSGGSDHTLGDRHAYEDGKPDCYMIGLHHEIVGDLETYSEQATAADAVVDAEKYAANPTPLKCRQHRDDGRGRCIDCGVSS